MKRILTREQYLDSIRKNNFTKLTKVSNEALSNEINWGDSLVGRLINSFIRKSKVAVNLRRIDSLSKRLRSIFDEMLETGKIDADPSLQSYLLTLTYFDELANKVSNEEEISVIIDHINIMISQIQSYNLVDGDILIEKLEEFRDFLKSQKKEEKEEVVKEEPEVVESKLNINDLFNNLILLKSVLSIVNTVSIEDNQSPTTTKNTEVGKGSGFKDKELVPPNFAAYRNKKGQERLGKITGGKVVDGEIQLTNKLEHLIWEEVDFSVPIKNVLNVVPSFKIGSKIKFKQGGVDTVGKVIKINGELITLLLDNGKKIGIHAKNTDFEVLESIIFEKIVIKSGDVKAVKVFTKLKSSVNVLTSSKDKGLSIDIKWIDSILQKKEDAKVQEIVAGLYKTVYSYLLGDKKATLNPDTKSIMEDFVDDYKLDTKYGYGIGKTQVAAEKIARFYYTCLKFTGDPLSLSGGDVGGYKLLGDLGDKLKELNVSTASILKQKAILPKKESVVEIKVGDVVSYESDEFGPQKKEVVRVEDDSVVLKGEKGEFSKKISDVKKVVESILKYKGFTRVNEDVDYGVVADEFERIFDDSVKDKFNITEEQKTKLENMVKSRDSIVITNSDPIMEIVRLFNRAWRIHTPGRIPSGRTGGKVSMSVFQEYESLGSEGSPESPGAGPYRNIELFEKWNEAVLSILGDTKYRTTIFSEDAKFAFLSGENLKRAVSLETITSEEGKKIEEKYRPLGKILLRFINNLLADTQMYKDKGAMPKFIEEYFGIKDDNIKGLSYPTFNDDVKNSEIASGIKTYKVEFIQEDFLKFLKAKNNENDLESLKNSLFKLKMKDGLTRYIWTPNDFNHKGYFLFVLFDSFPFDPTNIILKNYDNRKISDVRLISIKKDANSFEFRQSKSNLLFDKNIDKDYDANKNLDIKSGYCLMNDEKECFTHGNLKREIGDRLKKLSGVADFRTLKNNIVK